MKASGRLAIIPISDFVNGQLLSLCRFIHSALPCAITAHTKRDIKIAPAGSNSRMSCIGTARLRKLNGLAA